MSNYTKIEKAERAQKQEFNREYAEEHLSRERLIDYYCDYQQLKEDTEFHEEIKKNLRASIFFMFVSAYIASCVLYCILDKSITIVEMCFLSLLNAAIAFFFSIILKAPFANSKFILGKEKPPFWVYVVLLVLIPVAVRLIF